MREPELRKIVEEVVNVLAQKPEESLCRNVFNAGHANEVVGGQLLEVEEGFEPFKLKPGGKLGESMPPLTPDVVLVQTFKPFL